MILTDAFQVCESLGYIFLFMFLVPFLTRRADLLEVKIGRIKRLPNAWWVALFALQTLAILELAIYFFEALFGVGWHDPLSSGGLYYDLIFARSTFNVHLVGEVLVFGIGVFVLAAYRDIWLAFLTIGAFVGIHEGLWNLLYLYQYGTSDYLGDGTLLLLYLTFLIVFWRYPLKKIEIRFFIIPAFLYWFFLLGWFLFGFHVTVISDVPTIYYMDFWTNWAEVTGSIVLFDSMVLAIVYYRVKTTEKSGPSERDRGRSIEAVGSNGSWVGRVFEAEEHAGEEEQADGRARSSERSDLAQR